MIKGLVKKLAVSGCLIGAELDLSGRKDIEFPKFEGTVPSMLINNEDKDKEIPSRIDRSRLPQKYGINKDFIGPPTRDEYELFSFREAITEMFECKLEPMTEIIEFKTKSKNIYRSLNTSSKYYSNLSSEKLSIGNGNGSTTNFKPIK